MESEITITTKQNIMCKISQLDIALLWKTYYGTNCYNTMYIDLIIVIISNKKMVQLLTININRLAFIFVHDTNNHNLHPHNTGSLINKNDKMFVLYISYIHAYLYRLTIRRQKNAVVLTTALTYNCASKNASSVNFNKFCI